MRPVHFALIAVILAVGAIALLERTPDVADYDPKRHAAFKDTWDKRVHISYWEKWGSFEAEACQAMVDHFNASQQKIFVHYIRTSQVDRKSMLAIVGGAPPDVVGLWAYNVAPFAEGKALEPLDGRMEAAGLTEDHYVLNYLALGRYKGTTYALPTTPSAVGLFYNKEHFRRKAAKLRAKGLDPTRPPQTIEELDRYADVLNEFEDGRPRIMGFLPTEPGWFHTSWVYYFGGRLMDPNTGEITTDIEPNIRAFEWLKGYAERYGRQRLLQFRAGFGTFDSPQNAFIDGKVSMVMQGVWFPSFIARHQPHLDYGAAPFPCAEGVAGPRSLIDADVIAIPRGCPHRKEAWEFVKYVQTRGLRIICRLQGKHLPIRLVHPESLKDFGTSEPAEALAIFRRNNPNRFLHVFEEVAGSRHAFLMPRSVVWREYAERIGRDFEHIWNWAVPTDDLKKLPPEERQREIRRLCREEIVKTLGALRVRLQQKADQKRRRNRLRAKRGLR